jgi:hypothetical protein
MHELNLREAEMMRFRELQKLHEQREAEVEAKRRAI